MMVSPSNRVPERAPDWFFMGTEACSDGTPDLGFFSGVSIFIGKLASGTSQGGLRGGHEVGGRAPALQLPRGPSDLFPTPKIPINTKTPKNKPRSRVPPLQASVATKNQSRAHSGTLPEGETITGGHLHHPGGLHDEEGVVH